MAKAPFEISPAIKGRFKVLTHLPLLHTSTGTFDFRSITIEEAEKLVEMAPEYIKKVKTKAGKVDK